MAKIAITIKLTDEMYELVKAGVEALDAKQTNLFEGLTEYGLKKNLEDFMKFYTNGFEIKDGRYKDGIKQED